MRTKRIYSLLALSAIFAILALITGNFIFKSGTAAVGITVILLLSFQRGKLERDNALLGAAFLFSILGDWFLTHMNGSTEMFSKGIALFFLAHLGYLGYALYNGHIHWKSTLVILGAYLIFFYFILYPAFDEPILMWASLCYLLVSCLSLGAALGIEEDRRSKFGFVLGIFLILFSDTIISLKEFLGFDSLNFLILPTYYLAHISISFSAIRKSDVTI